MKLLKAILIAIVVLGAGLISGCQEEQMSYDPCRSAYNANLSGYDETGMVPQECLTGQ